MPAREPEETVTLPVPSEMYAYRVEQYLLLGFTETDAHVLAVAREDERDSVGRLWERPLNWRRVERALGSGCSHERAVQIFS